MRPLLLQKRQKSGQDGRSKERGLLWSMPWTRLLVTILIPQRYCLTFRVIYSTLSLIIPLVLFTIDCLVPKRAGQMMRKEQRRICVARWLSTVRHCRTAEPPYVAPPSHDILSQLFWRDIIVHLSCFGETSSHPSGFCRTVTKRLCSKLYSRRCSALPMWSSCSGIYRCPQTRCKDSVCCNACNNVQNSRN